MGYFFPRDSRTSSKQPLYMSQPGRVAQTVGHLGSWVRYPVWQHTIVSPSTFSRRAAVNYWRKYVHEVLINRLGGLSLPRKSVVRLTDRPDMTLDVDRGRKTTIQQQLYKSNNQSFRTCMTAVFVLPIHKRQLDWEPR